MCGIYGFIGFRDDKLLSKMGRTLSHRGPDAQNEVVLDGLSFGYRRLAIIDLGGSFQPLYNEDESICLFFNGEIYNYKELRKSLKGKHNFRTSGDGETIIHYFEEHGVKGFTDLNGIFGFSLYDRRKNRLFAVRDHLGIKPVYYFKQGQDLVFASEIKAILTVLRSRRIPVKMDPETVERYLVSRVHDDRERTFFAGIKRVPSGSYLEWDFKRSSGVVKSYWKLTPNSKLVLPSDEENVQRFRELFLQAVKRQLMSEVPLGTALSGGLDSSAIVAAVNKEIRESEYQEAVGERQRTFSAVFPGMVNNEEKYIDEVVKDTMVADFKTKPTADGLWKEIEKVIYHHDEPMISSGPYAWWKVMGLVSGNRVKVMLDGQGADEMLAGYVPYYFVYFRELFRRGEYFTLFKEVILAADVIWPFIREKIEYLVGIKTGFRVDELFSFGKITARVNSVQSNLSRRLIEDILKNSLPALLRYEDKTSMAFSIEARVPFLDVPLVEFVASLPSRYKIRDGWNKWIMREALKGILPEKIRTRRWKVGFTTPEVAWMRQSANEVRKILNSKSFNQRSFFNAPRIRERFEEFASGKNDESMVFWRIVNLELWLRVFCD